MAGEVSIEILKLLDEAKDSGKKVYACLFELNDPGLLEQLESLGSNMNLILVNGSPDKKELDKNNDLRKKLRKNSKIRLYDRIVKKPHLCYDLCHHLCHHMFLVLCNKNDDAEEVWTGSSNWTVTGLCT